MELTNNINNAVRKNLKIIHHVELHVFFYVKMLLDEQSGEKPHMGYVMRFGEHVTSSILVGAYISAEEEQWWP